jgi:hypothetical protein
MGWYHNAVSCFLIEYNNYYRSAEYYEYEQHNFDSQMHV